MCSYQSKSNNNKRKGVALAALSALRGPVISTARFVYLFSVTQTLSLRAAFARRAQASYIDLSALDQLSNGWFEFS